MSTPYHAQYLAHELTKRLPADQAEKLTQSLSNATVDLNPHQVDAALFAFRSPLSRGAILADEVGLGKTIEAGLVVSQLWAERKRRILCIVPASLRKQWNRELLEKFFIESVILETKSFNNMQRDQKVLNPFEQKDRVVICSYQFAAAKDVFLTHIPWDLVVIDEAHRLRNVYKKTNKIARKLLDCVGQRPKVLLTATPFQNTLMELYGLVTFIDDKIFGSEDAFRETFARKVDQLPEDAFNGLRHRLAPICQRTLRKQVIEYVNYTNRIPITQDFTPAEDEIRLYDEVSAYLQKDNLYALPNAQRQLITLILRKILASSTFAIGASLEKIITRLEVKLKTAEEPSQPILDQVGEDFEQADELADEWEEDEENAEAPEQQINIAILKSEIEELRKYRTLASSIKGNAKGDALLKALEVGFARMDKLGAARKAIVFTESRKTQTYLKELLDSNGYKGQVVLFNGTNSDPDSKRVYAEWLKRHVGEEVISGSASADSRAALVEEFKDRASIMIATEAASEGVNLQFCSLVVNYDLPWNPQRVEQRIGRCHRYGQKYDVVVVNFLNRSNEADQRVFELLNEKFRLFDGVFGASDEVLGAIESGLDIERRIHSIYQTCRSSEDIKTAFDQLRRELDESIQATLKDTKKKLLENFDAEVHRKLRFIKEETWANRDRFSTRLLSITRAELSDYITVGDSGSFTLNQQPPELPKVPLGVYAVAGSATAADHHYRIGHPLAEALIDRAKSRELPTRKVTFNPKKCTDGRVIVVENLIGKSGWLFLKKYTLNALECEEHLVFSAMQDGGTPIDPETCQKFFEVPASVEEENSVPADIASNLELLQNGQRENLLVRAGQRNNRYFEAEMSKLDQWAEDVKADLDRQVRELTEQYNTLKKEALLAPMLATKLELQKKAAEVDKQRKQKRRTIYDEQDRIDEERNRLLEETAKRLEQQVSAMAIFTIRWQVR